MTNMKYWIFQDNAVSGPYEPEDLVQTPGFSTETLVCPEGRKGTRMGDWQRSSAVPALSASLVKAAQLSSAGRAAPAGNAYSGPAVPALKDLAMLGSLQEKMVLLENAIAQLQKELQSKGAEVLSLQSEVTLRKTAEAELQGKAQEFQQRLAALSERQSTLDGAIAAEQSVATEVKGVASSVQEVRTSVDGVSGTVKNLESALELQRRTTAELMVEIQHIKEERAAAPARVHLPPSQPAASEMPLAPMSAGASLAERAAPEMEPEPAAAPPPFFLGAPAPAPEPMESPAAAFPGVDAAASPAEAPEAPPIEPAPAIAPPPAPARPKARIKSVVLVALGSGFVAAGVIAFYAGLIPIPGHRRTPQSRAPVSDTSPTPAPPPPSPEAQMEELKGQAVALVRSWPIEGQGDIVGHRLESSYPKNGNLSPWMAEKLGDDSFQVNFYGAKSSAGKPEAYEFQVNLGANSVTPINAAAKALVHGSAAGGPEKKVRVKPKNEASAGQVENVGRGMVQLGPRPVNRPAKGSGQSTAAGKHEGIAKAKAKVKVEAKAEAEAAAAPAEEAKAEADPAPEAAKKPAKPAGVQSLDQLLDEP